MDEQEWFERLDSTAESPAGLFEHFERRSADGDAYYALPDARHGVERGTVLLVEADAVARGYPSIPRVLVLEPGVSLFFEADEPVVVEEKLDGFNVRIIHADEPVAFTRGGYVCPYTTARARELLDLDPFFSTPPEKMLCAELLGPETPYTTHDYDGVDSHEMRVFGIRDRESGAPLPVTERRELCSAYGFAQPRRFARGPASDTVADVRDAIADLDADGREGVVMKSADGESAVKYTTESQHHDDLASGFSVPFDSGREFLFSRIVREAFQAAEFDGSEERLRERAHDIGESILLPTVETIRDVEAGESVGEQHTVRGRPETIDALLDHLREQSLTLDIQRDRRENGERVVEVVKVAEPTRDRIQYYLDGGTYDE